MSATTEKTMNAATGKNRPSSQVLDDAFTWAVRLASGTVSAEERDAFDTWLNGKPEHEIAWRRIQAIEQEFSNAKTAAGSGSAALRRVDGARRSRQKAKAVFGIVVGAILMSAAALKGPIYMDRLQADHVTWTDENRTIDLAGGAKLYLKGGTAADVSAENGLVTVTIRHGEILLNTSGAGASAKPIVSSDHGSFTPIGTRFVVKKSDDATDVAVIEGRVKAEAMVGEPALTIEAGNGARLSPEGAARLASNGIVPGAWIDGIVEADNARLGSVMDLLTENAWSIVHIDAAAADMRISGVFKLDDLDSAVGAMQRILPIRVQNRTGFWISITAE